MVPVWPHRAEEVMGPQAHQQALQHIEQVVEA